MLDAGQYGIGAACGLLIGGSLSLLGGGGSILAVPMMLYVVGVPNPHVAVGTGALAVAANAGGGLASHSRAGNVQWRTGALFAAAGALGAFVGASVGKRFDGDHLLLLFAGLMMVVGIIMARPRPVAAVTAPTQGLSLPRILGFGLGSGLLSGFFGIGGGFLVVPALIAATGMSMLSAVGTSLIAVTTFCSMTALNYAFSMLVDWRLALCMVGGGLAGNLLGSRLCCRLTNRDHLRLIFCPVILAVAAFVGYKALTT